MRVRTQRFYGTALAAAAVCVVAAPGQAQAAGAPGMPVHSEADARFMQDMIVHHAQAVEMTALVPERTEREDVRRLAARIEISQQDELELMERWLESRDEPVPDAREAAGHSHHHPSIEHGLMHGLQDAEAMARLRESTGAEFDRLFLEAMIRHHEGALVMVAELLATDGAGQEAEIFQFASHVESDQRIEIERMRQMLEAGD
jgi:uncharacterized protein (DUF305 family)